MLVPLAPEAERELDDEIVERVREAEAVGEPIAAVRGPKFDIRLKASLGLNYNQGVICTRVKRLVYEGVLRIEESPEKFEVSYGSHATRRYPLVTLHPSW